MNRREIENVLAESCGFRVSPVGNRKVEFLVFYGEGDEQMSRVRATRPATPQEGFLWDRLVGVLELADRENPGGLKEFLPGGAGVDATKVRDPLGNPRE